MPFEQHVEKTYAMDPQAVYQAALKATEKLEGKTLVTDAAHSKVEAHFPKVILKQTLGERTYICCEVRPQEGGSLVAIDAYPLDAVNRKLMFGARKGVTQTVVTWFIAHLENNLGILQK